MSVALLVAGIALFGIGVWRAKVAVIGALVLAVFDGAVRKWVIPDHGQAVYFAKDFLLLGGYVGVFVPRLFRRQSLIESHPANPALALLAVLGVCQVANPALATVGVGLFGLKAYLFDVPLMYLVPQAFRSAKELRRFWIGFLACAAIPVALGILQFAAPPESELNRYAWEDEAEAESVATFGEAGSVRITGTFAYISGYAVYLTVIVLMGIPVLLSDTNRWVRAGTYGLIVVALGNLLMTGSRAPFLVLAVAVAALLILVLRHGAVAGSRTALLVVVMLSAAVVVAQGMFPEAWGAFAERVAGSDDVRERVTGVVSDPFPAAAAAGLFGYGIGSTHQAAMFLISDGTAYARPPEAEGEWERIVLEMGPVGFALVIVVRLLVVGKLWTAFASSGQRERWFIATALLFAGASIPGNLVFNHTASVFYWFFAGIALTREGSDVEYGKKALNRRQLIDASGRGRGLRNE